MRVELDGKILVLTFDEPGKGANVLNRTAMEQLSDAITRAETDSTVGGVLLRSAKAGNFIAGADVKEIDGAPTPEELRALVRRGQELFDRIEKLPKPVVAAINGTCLGGGLELAMACHYRLAADDKATKLGLPETKLGLLPGWGGTWRLPKLVGLQRGLTMILKGEAVSARQARDYGLVQEAVPAYALERSARDVLEKALAAGGKLPAPPRKRKKGWGDWLLERNPLGRSVVFNKATEAAHKETGGHYPAADAVIEALRAGAKAGKAAALAVEAQRLPEMAFTPQGKNLRRIFFLSEAAKRKAKGGGPVNLAGVIGAGTMGSAIAAVLAGSGATVRLRDVDEKALAAGLGKVRKIIDYDLKKKNVSKVDAEARFHRILPTTTWTGLANADIVIEAVIEDLAAKREVFAKLDGLVGEKCVLASNTSALDIDELAAGTSHPERVVGLHFFNPVERMPLVEIVRGKFASDAAVSAALGVARQIGKVPIVVKNRPGFLVNRILGPYLVAAGRMLLETRDARRVDDAAKVFGMPMGPLELLDTIGLDVAASVVATLRNAFGDRLAAPSVFADMIGEKMLGKKTGTGFWQHDGKELTANPKIHGLVRMAAERDNVPAYADEPLVIAGPDLPSPLAARLIFPMIDEAARALDEGVCESGDDIDLAMVLGTGFAPFRGGLWHYALHIGLDNVARQMDEWARTLGPNFAPSDSLRKFAHGPKEPGVPATPAPATVGAAG